MGNMSDSITMDIITLTMGRDMQRGKYKQRQKIQPHTYRARSYPVQIPRDTTQTTLTDGKAS